MGLFEVVLKFHQSCPCSSEELLLLSMMENLFASNAKEILSHHDPPLHTQPLLPI